MTTTNERIAALHGRQLGPVGFDSRAGRLIATVFGRSVNVEPDGDALWCSATTNLPRSQSGLVDDQMTGSAISKASSSLGGLSVLTVADNLVTASTWIESSASSVVIATACREVAKMCDFVDGIMDQLEAAAAVRTEVERLERQVGESGASFRASDT